MTESSLGEEVINGYSIDLLARALYDARKQVGGYCTDVEWAQHAQRFPQSHRLLMDDARREAEDE